MADDVITLIDFDPVRDTPRLRDWLYRRHVAKWWLNPADQLADCLNRPPGGGHALIDANGVSIGYLRWQPIDYAVFLRHGVRHIPRDALDLDIFIGESEYLGRGIGPRALDLLARRIKSDTDASYLVLMTSVNNHHAIRAYEKVGFELVLKFEDQKYGWSQVMALPLDGIALG